MKIALNEFGGMAPGIEPRALADKLATDAYNVDFSSGVLGESIVTAQPSLPFSPLAAQCMSILRPGNDDTRLQLTTATNGVAFASLLSVSDQWGRVYYTTASGPRYTVADNYLKGGLSLNPVSYKLGVPTPLYPAVVGTPAFTVPAGQAADLSYVAYIFTFVDKYGHEGAPSPPSTQAQLPNNLPFTCNLNFTAESLPEFPISGAVRRVYRAAFDGSSSEWQFLADIPIALGGWTDNVPMGNEGEALVSTDWVPPPVGLQRMTPVASNFVAGFYSNYLCYSEALLPHAWPEAYRFPLKYPIVGMAATQNGLLVATLGKPYWCSGADPASATPVELDANHPCLSAKSIVDMGGYVIYASHDGLVAVAGSDVKVITKDFMDRRTWLRDFVPANIVAFAHEGYYVFSVGNQWWMFDPAGGGFVVLGLSAVLPSTLRQAYYDAMRDTVVLLNSAGVAFDIVSGPGGAFRWKSKVLTTPPVSFSFARVLSTVYPVTLTVTADGVARSYVVTGRQPFRLAGGQLNCEWQLEVAAPSGARVTEIGVCQSTQELR
ncbi:hypothetical protein NL64_06115 [Pseudomonas fluorescens]|uniref:hypothetical protein n=1 Tax=Pseudomonas fluorescens TaxID=294 RepID=UPI00054B0A66|nr:hypothetical protein [Pseudomonas fluorescens]KII34838.1 hypothetical protein NL64_06115 [Pseudomonas fluorescens]